MKTEIKEKAILALKVLAAFIASIIIVKGFIFFMWACAAAGIQM